MQSLTETKQRLDELEQEKLKNLPVDAAKEIALLQALVVSRRKNKLIMIAYIHTSYV